MQCSVMLSVLFLLSSLPSDRSLWSPSQAAVRAMSSSGGPSSPYTTLAVNHPAEFVTHVEFHRPEKRNAMNKAFWRQESFTFGCLFVFIPVRHVFAVCTFVFTPSWQMCKSRVNLLSFILSLTTLKYLLLGSCDK